MAATFAGIGGAQASPSCEPRLAALSVRPGATEKKVWDLLKPDFACLREFSTGHLYGKAIGKTWVGLKIGWAIALVNHWGVVNCVRHIHWVSDMAPSCWLCGSAMVALRKGTMVLASISFWDKTVPQLLPWIQTIQLYPYVSGVFLSVAPMMEPKGSQSKLRLCVGPLRGIAYGSSSFCLPQPQSSWFLQPEVMGTSLHGTGTLGWGPDMGLGCLTPQISILIFICHMWVLDQPVLPLSASFQSQCSFFFNSIVVRLLFSWISDRYKWWLLYSLVVIWCGCARRGAVLIYTTTLTGIPISQYCDSFFLLYVRCVPAYLHLRW